MTLPTCTLKIHIPILNNTPPLKSCHNEILNHPVNEMKRKENDSDRLTFMQSLQDPANGVVQELEAFLNTLNPAHEEATAFLRKLDHENARNIKRLHSLRHSLTTAIDLPLKQLKTWPVAWLKLFTLPIKLH